MPARSSPRAPEQEQSGAEPFFFGKKEDEFSVDSVPEEEGIERERCENKNLRGCTLMAHELRKLFNGRWW